MNLKSPVWIYIGAGISSVALAAVVLVISTPTVHADARIPQPAVSSSPAPNVAGATPATLAPQAGNPNQAIKGRTDRVHGIASWYGGVFNGRLTASGERFDMNAMTACHPTLPFGSLVRVVNLANKRSVVVRITDRGDLVSEGRIIDLSFAAAQELAMTESGLAKVDLRVISLGPRHGSK